MNASRLIAITVVLMAAGTALAQPAEVNVSGATLFRDFFTKPASTNDWINVDGDSYQQCFDFYYDPNQGWVCTPKTCVQAPWKGFDPCNIPLTDQLALTFQPGPVCDAPGSHWLVQYRGVGSGNGLAEMRDWAVDSKIPTDPPAEAGYINRVLFAELGIAKPVAGCAPCNASGTPICPTSIDIGVMDVPTKWFVVQDGTPGWDRKPGEAGFGLNPRKSYSCCPGSQSNKLKSLCGTAFCLNTNTANPDERTVFDIPIAWVPIAFIANPGTVQGTSCCPPRDCMSISELQHLFITGRLKNGLNLVAVTRDAGSGTRNGAMNSICVDPSWGMGDNCGPKHETATETLVGPHFVPNNCGGSGIMEDTVKNSRLAIGYTGLAGSSRAIGDAIAGRYEILDVLFDVQGGNTCVRPRIDSVLDNCDPNTGYLVGGPETFAIVGDPTETNPQAPTYVENQEAAAYLNNITQSIVDFVENPTSDEQTAMPGQYLAEEFFLLGGIDCLPEIDDPCSFIPNVDLNQDLQEYMRANNGLGVGRDTPDFGAYSNLYPIPKRAQNSDYACPTWDPPGLVWPDTVDPDVCDPQNPPNWEPMAQCDCPYPPAGEYSDGSTNGAYHNPHKPVGTYDIIGGQPLNSKNWLAGDFNQDGCRNINDIPYMLQAYYDRYENNDPQYTTYRALPNVNSTEQNPVVPEIIGDFNTDGNFDCRDIRYFCDGLALDPNGCMLHRWDAFVLVDNTWNTLTGDNNFFNTQIEDCNGNPVAYVVGAAAADVAGGMCAAPGAKPMGYDCKVNCSDLFYIERNFGDWADLDVAVNIDLSCDLNNDLMITGEDALIVVNLMGCKCKCVGDMNGDGWVNFGDINPFVLYLSNYDGWKTEYPWVAEVNGDINDDGVYGGTQGFGDINPFVALMGQAGQNPIKCE